MRKHIYNNGDEPEKMNERLKAAIVLGKQLQKDEDLFMYISDKLGCDIDRLDGGDLSAQFGRTNTNFTAWGNAVAASMKLKKNQVLGTVERKAIQQLDGKIDAVAKLLEAGCVPEPEEATVEGSIMTVKNDFGPSSTEVLLLQGDACTLEPALSQMFTDLKLQLLQWAGSVFCASPPFGLGKFDGDDPNTKWGDDKYQALVGGICAKFPDKDKVFAFQCDEDTMVECARALNGMYPYHQLITVKSDAQNPVAHGWYHNVLYLLVYYVMADGGPPQRNKGYWFANDDDRTPVSFLM
jgi:hypothetical protein